MTPDDLHADLAAAFCPHPQPCASCDEAAYRVVVHRGTVRRLLTVFAEHEDASAARAAKPLPNHNP